MDKEGWPSLNEGDPLFKMPEFEKATFAGK
jgi:hypothetical protein